jgi:hypothetical protein
VQCETIQTAHGSPDEAILAWPRTRAATLL